MRRPRSIAAPVGALPTMAALAGLVVSPGPAGAQTEAGAGTSTEAEAQAQAQAEFGSWLDALTGDGQSETDNDTRYDRFLCPPVSGRGVAETRSTCPLS